MSVPTASPERLIYLAACKFQDAAAQSDYLDEACGSDRELRKRLERLLQFQSSPESRHLERALGEFGQSDLRASKLMHGSGQTEGTDSNLTEREASSNNPKDDTLDARIDVNQHPSIGRYKLLEELGQGGMGSVYMAQQTEPVRRKVALKVIKPGMDSREVIARFQAERQALAMMDHPNIARVLDAGTTDEGRPYFVMELVRGIPITKFCDEKKLNLDDRLKLFIDICKAVQHAHQKAIIHRDLKPGNILVTLHDGEAVVKVIDFGVAKALNQELTEETLFTQFSQMIGTPLYMSPEQVELSGLDVDTRSDIYSLGVVLYELLTGTTPIQRESLAKLGVDAIREMIREQEPDRPSSRISTLEAHCDSTVATRSLAKSKRTTVQLKTELDWIVLKALEKDRTRRYETANAFAADVQRYLDGDAVEACPPSRTYRLLKMTRRHQAAFTTTAMVAIALLMGIILSGWQAWEANKARNLATRRLDLVQEQRRRERLAAVRYQELEYAADMKLASDAYSQGDVARLTELLERHRPQSGQTDLRGFEWYYLDRTVRSRQVVSFQHERPVWCVEYSPDGSLLAASTDDGLVLVFDSKSMQLRERLPTDGLSVNGIAWTTDQKLIAAGVADGSVFIWNWESRSLHSRFFAHKGEAFDVIFVADRKQLASGGEDGEIAVHDLDDGSLVRRWKAHEREVEQLDLSTDCKLLASISADGYAATWHLESGTLNKRMSCDGSPLTSVAFAPNGKKLAYASRSGKVAVSDLANGTGLKLPRIFDRIGGLAFVDHGSRLAVGDASGTVHIYDSVLELDGSVQPSMNADHWLAHGDRVQSIAAATNGRTLTTSGRDGRIAVWDLRQPPSEWTCGLSNMMVMQNAETFIMASSSIQLRNIHNGDVEHLSGTIGKSWQHLALARSAPLLAAGSGNEMQVFDTDRKVSLVAWQLPFPIYALGISPTGRQVAVSWNSGDSTVHLYAVDDPVEPIVIPAPSSLCICFTPDERYLALGSNNDIMLFDTSSKTIAKTLAGHREAVRQIAFSEDGQWLASVSDDRQLKIWNVASGQPSISVTAHSAPVTALCYSSDGRTIATGCGSGKVKLWRAASGQLLLEIDVGKSRVGQLQFSRDSKRLACRLVGEPTLVFDATPLLNHAKGNRASTVGE